MKEQFLLDDSVVFLNHGSFGACPRPVFEAFQNYQREMERNPVEFLGRRSAELLLESRKALAQYLHADARDLIYVPNATTGVNIVARSLELAPDDVIVTTDHEYGACDNAWDFVASSSGAKIVRVAIPFPYRAEDFVDRIFAAVTPATRLIYVSHITSTTALIFPVAELCARARQAGVLTLIDGAHAPGQIDLDLSVIDADFYVGNCHKWLCAPKGAGFLYARSELQRLLDAPVISWGYSPEIKGHADFTAYVGHTLFEQRMQWQGTRDIAAFLAVADAIRFQAHHHWSEVRARCHQSAWELHERMRERTGLPALYTKGDCAQMVALALPYRDPVALKRRLFDDYRVEVPVTQHGGHLFVRVSVQGYNQSSDLVALEAAIGAIYGMRS